MKVASRVARFLSLPIHLKVENQNKTDNDKCVFIPLFICNLSC